MVYLLSDFNEVIKMKKVKVLNIFSLILNLAIVGFVVYGVILLANANALVGSLMYFTVESNLLVGVAAFIAAIFAIISLVKKQALPKAVNVFKLIATVGVALTLITVAFVLAPMHGWNFPTQFGGFKIDKIEFIYHLIVPSISIITYFFFDTGKGTKWTVNFLSIIFPLLYGVFYVVNHYVNFVEGLGYEGTALAYDWYGFFTFEQVAFTFLMLAGLLVGAFLVSLFLWFVNKKVTSVKVIKGVYNNAATIITDRPIPREETKPVEEEKEQVEEQKDEAPVANSAPEEPKEEVSSDNVYRVVEPEAEPAEEEIVEEEAPVEEAPVEEPVKEEKKEAPKKAPAKKAAPKKEEAKKEEKKEALKKSAPKKEEAKKEAPKKAPAKKKEEPKKEESSAGSKDGTKVYHLTKRKEDGMWAITFVGGKKAIKLFKTKKEAEEYLKTLTENQGATALIRNSKGSKAGKFASSIKSKEE